MAKQPGPNVYQRGGVYWCRFVVKGREYRRSLSTGDARTAARRAQVIRNDMIAAVKFGDNRTTIATALKAWIAEANTNLGPRTFDRYMVSLKQIKPWLDGLYVDQIDKKLVNQIVNERRKGGAKNATIRRDLTALSSFLRFCYTQDWHETNPAKDRLEHLEERRDPIVLPVERDVQRMAQRCPPNMRALMLAALHTGCRQSELTELRRDQVDWNRRKLTVIGKGNKRRTLDLSPEALDALKSAVPDLRTPHVFQHDGQPYLNLATRFRKLMVGVEKSAHSKAQPFRAFRFHDLRHLYAVNYLKAGGGIYTLSLILGHTSVKVTEGYLAHLSPDEAAQAKAKSGAAG